jgi:hypothetical protein
MSARRRSWPRWTGCDEHRRRAVRTGRRDPGRDRCADAPAGGGGCRSGPHHQPPVDRDAGRGEETATHPAMAMAGTDEPDTDPSPRPPTDRSHPGATVTARDGTARGGATRDTAAGAGSRTTANPGAPSWTTTPSATTVHLGPDVLARVFVDVSTHLTVHTAVPVGGAGGAGHGRHWRAAGDRAQTQVGADSGDPRDGRGCGRRAENPPTLTAQAECSQSSTTVAVHDCCLLPRGSAVSGW